MNNNNKMISESGAAFLKVATASPDFEALDLQGIPDHHNGPTVCMKQYVTETVSAPAGFATYFLFTPTAATSYWKTSIATGSDWLNGQDVVPHFFTKASQIFESCELTPTATYEGGTNSGQVSSGRVISSAAELQVLNNAFNRYGSITAWKCPLRTEITTGGASVATQIQIAGIDGVRKTVVGSQAYTAPVGDGVYSVSMNREEEFGFFPVLNNENRNSIHDAVFGAPDTPPGIRANFNGPLVLFDNNYDTIVFRIDVQAGVADQSFLLKRWVNLEFQPVFNSLLWDTSHLSPEADEIAIAIYREMSRNLPMAVPQRDNPDFWNIILGLVNESSSLLSYVPGPIGQVAKGVHAVAQALTPKKKKRRSKKPPVPKGPKPQMRTRKGKKKR